MKLVLKSQIPNDLGGASHHALSAVAENEADVRKIAAMPTVAKQLADELRYGEYIPSSVAFTRFGLEDLTVGGCGPAWVVASQLLGPLLRPEYDLVFERAYSPDGFLSVAPSAPEQAA